MAREKISIKEYTRFVIEKQRVEPATDEEIDGIMFSYGFKYNEEI